MPITDIENVLWPNGQNNDAGITMKIYYCLWNDIETFPGVDDSSAATDFADMATIASPIVFKSGKAWKEMYATLEKGKLDCEMVGERDGKAFRNTATLSHPGNAPKSLGWTEFMKNTHAVLLVQELDGNWRLVGNNILPAQVSKATITTGDAIDSNKGMMVEVESIGRIAPRYTGAITLTPAP